MQMAFGNGLFAAVAASLLCACTPSGTADAPTASTPPPSGQSATAPLASTSTRGSTHSYTDATWSFRIDVPARWTIHHEFPKDYLANGAWETFTAPDSQGEPVLALTVPGSNRVTDAEIRIGASRAAAELHRCTTPPSAVRPGSVTTQRINDVTFTTFEAADAAMSHHLTVHAWRVVHGGACYAIDLLVYGVNPEVYDPPATPPFNNTQAFAQMQEVVQTFRFTR